MLFVEENRPASLGSIRAAANVVRHAARDKLDGLRERLGFEERPGWVVALPWRGFESGGEDGVDGRCEVDLVLIVDPEGSRVVCKELGVLAWLVARGAIQIGQVVRLVPGNDEVPRVVICVSPVVYYSARVCRAVSDVPARR